jgi:Mg2+-importing ATPase
VANAKRQYGENRLSEQTPHTAFHLFIKQFANPIILILIVATIISMIVGEVVSGFIILAILIPSGLLGYWQERRAGKTMEALRTRIAIKVEVIRNGQEVSVATSELVPGDLLVLRVGDLVPADCLVAESQGLLIDESLLTGESYPREKSTGAKSLSLHDRSTELFQGTHVVGGKGKAVVTKIGEMTEFSHLVKETISRDTTTGFERGIAQFGNLLIRSMLALVGGLFLVNIFLHRPFIDSLLFSLALAVGLTPQLLPVIISVSLSVGARLLATKKVLVKRFDAIEDLGLMNVLCTDKTGTLTTGVLTLKSTPSISSENDGQVARLAFLNASLQTGFPNPLDTAIVSALGAQYLKGVLLDELPYDFQRRRLSILVDDSTPLLISKGAFHEILDSCNFVRKGLTESAVNLLRADLIATFENLCANGSRVLGLATRKLENKKALSTADEVEMTFEGFLVFNDPLKVGAIESIKELNELGIDLYLITGDNPITAKAIAQGVGLPSNEVLTGDDISSMSAIELSTRLTSIRIFASINPLQKREIVKALQLAGKTVGFFGDGINDAPALHAADVGISVDTAVDVAKAASSIVLLEKDLAVIADGIRLGRRTFVNTLKYIRVGVSAAFGNVFSMAIADVFLPFLPLLPVQILLLNFMTDFPAITISGDSVDAEMEQRPAQWNIKLIRKLMIIFGLISTVFDLATFAILRLGYHASPELFRTGWFIESTFTELAVMLVLRTNRRFWQSRPGRGLLWSSVILAVLTLILPLTSLGRVIGLTVAPRALVLALLGLIGIYVAINEMAKRLWWR